MAEWNKNTPDGSVAGSSIDDYIRELKDYVEDALGREHVFPTTEANNGQHKTDSLPVVQVVDDVSSLSLVEGGLGFVTSTQDLYTYYDDQLHKITEDVDDIPVGTIMVFYQDTAPSGWSIVTDYDDHVVVIKSSSSATGGYEWGDELAYIKAHTHEATLPDHQHGLPFSQNDFYIRTDNIGGGSTLDIRLPVSSTSYSASRMATENPTSHPTITTDSVMAALRPSSDWRPSHLKCIVCEYEGA